MPVRQISDGMADRAQPRLSDPAERQPHHRKGTSAGSPDFSEPRGFRRPIDVFFRSLAVDQGQQRRLRRAVRHRRRRQRGPARRQGSRRPHPGAGSGDGEIRRHAQERGGHRSGRQGARSRQTCPARSATTSSADRPASSTFPTSPTFCSMSARNCGTGSGTISANTSAARCCGASSGACRWSAPPPARNISSGCASKADEARAAVPRPAHQRHLFLSRRGSLRFSAPRSRSRRCCADKGAGDTVRIWAPGCSSGEEAYSIAILMAEASAAHAGAASGADLRHRHRRADAAEGAQRRLSAHRRSRTCRSSCSTAISMPRRTTTC